MKCLLRIRALNPETLLRADRDGAEVIADVAAAASGEPPQACVTNCPSHWPP